MMKNVVFVLIGKERYIDAVPSVLTAVQPENVERIYDLCSKMSKQYDGLDLMLYTYSNGHLSEVSTYDEFEDDFKILTRFENE